MSHDPAEGRAAAVRTQLGRTGALRRIELGESNHVWFAGDIVIRMATAPGHSDLCAEADLVTALPAAVGYPAVVGSGVEDGHDWMATERIAGENLGRVWPDLTIPERLRAIEDLYARLEHVHRTDPGRIDPARSTPFYALDPAAASRDLDGLHDILEDSTMRILQEILDNAFEAIPLVPRALVHTDTGPGNTVWDGRRAVPVDFEFACLGPADLDVESLARSLRDEPVLLRRLSDRAGPELATAGAYERILGYAVLRDVWAVGKWIAIWPERKGIENWQPVAGLRAHAAGTSWVTQLFPGRCGTIG